MTDAHTHTPLWLLLLPRPPTEVTLNTLRISYGPGLTRALRDASGISRNSDGDVQLDIAVASDAIQKFHYSTLQNLYGLMYKLICIICTEESIDLQYGNDVDARVIVFPYYQHRHDTHNAGWGISLQSLALLNRPWTTICSLESENGEEMLQLFLRTRTASNQEHEKSFEVVRLPGGLSIRSDTRPDGGAAATQAKASDQFTSVAVGGTFDHLHAGHKLLLTMTALLLQPHGESRLQNERILTVGITGDVLLQKKKYREDLEGWDQRQSRVQNFLLSILGMISPNQILQHTQDIPGSKSQGREIHNELQSGLKIKCVEIFDPCGPTITDPAIKALVVSTETRAGGKAVNDTREEKDWPALEVFEVDVLNAKEDESEEAKHRQASFEGKISSTGIRLKIHQKRNSSTGTT